MDWNKYIAVPTIFATAKEIGVAPQTLSAMVRRGLIESTNTSPKKYRRTPSRAFEVHRIIHNNKDDYEEFFTLHQEGEPLAMMCYMVNDDVVDCWGNLYNLTTIDKIQFRTREFNFIDGVFVQSTRLKQKPKGVM